MIGNISGRQAYPYAVLSFARWVLVKYGSRPTRIALRLTSVLIVASASDIVRYFLAGFMNRHERVAGYRLAT